MSPRLAAAVLLGAAVAGAALGHTRGLRSGMAIGYAYGDRDGTRRGDASARLDMVLDAPHSPSFWEAVRDGALSSRVAREVQP